MRPGDAERRTRSRAAGGAARPAPPPGWQAWAACAAASSSSAPPPAAGRARRAAAAAAADDGSPCSFTIKDPRITESSGLAASRLHPGVYWTHNDSDDGPYVYAVDSGTGKTVATGHHARHRQPRDVEAISIGPDGHLYVGDIGDNLGGTWPHVWIYRFPEPKQLKDTDGHGDPVHREVRRTGRATPRR